MEPFEGLSMLREDEEPAPSASWAQSSTGCLSDVEVCVLSHFCPCSVQGENADRMASSSAPGLASFGRWTTCCLWTAFPCFVGAWQRSKVRERYQIPGRTRDDLLAHCVCCCCCSIAQEAVQLQAMAPKEVAKAVVREQMRREAMRNTPAEVIEQQREQIAELKRQLDTTHLDQEKTKREVSIIMEEFRASASRGRVVFDRVSGHQKRIATLTEEVGTLREEKRQREKASALAIEGSAAGAIEDAGRLQLALARLDAVEKTTGHIQGSLKDIRSMRNSEQPLMIEDDRLDGSPEKGAAGLPGTVASPEENHHQQKNLGYDHEQATEILRGPSLFEQMEDDGGHRSYEYEGAAPMSNLVVDEMSLEHATRQAESEAAAAALMNDDNVRRGGLDASGRPMGIGLQQRIDRGETAGMIKVGDVYMAPLATTDTAKQLLEARKRDQERSDFKDAQRRKRADREERELKEKQERAARIKAENTARDEERKRKEQERRHRIQGHLDTGTRSMKMGKPALALSSYQQALDEDPEHVVAKAEVGRCEAQLMKVAAHFDSDDEDEETNRARHRQNAVHAAREQAQAALDAGRHHDAIMAYKRGLKLDKADQSLIIGLRKATEARDKAAAAAKEAVD